jgi:hypothetical protein
MAAKCAVTVVELADLARQARQLLDHQGDRAAERAAYLQRKGDVLARLGR